MKLNASVISVLLPPYKPSFVIVNRLSAVPAFAMVMLHCYYHIEYM